MIEEELSRFSPKVDLKETDDEIIVSFEVPGMSENDVEVHVSDNMLTVSGEKKEEKEEDTKGYYR
ncbi:Hsp20/alpha crystallin family protein, partial [Enterococcus faecalis]|uniref:Hsp20/alpha crystallin family protein n=1 Tax=Enterococcus faecalis TaxID=1351 RepID=UPI00403EF88E